MPRPPRPTEAEERLLALARELTALGRRGAPLADALALLAEAHAPDGPLPRAAAQAWLKGRSSKSAALALAWAREQVRLAIEELLERTLVTPRIAAPTPTRAWLFVAACEAIAQEPPQAAADRVRALLHLAGESA